MTRWIQYTNLQTDGPAIDGADVKSETLLVLSNGQQGLDSKLVLAHLTLFCGGTADAAGKLACEILFRDYLPKSSGFHATFSSVGR